MDTVKKLATLKRIRKFSRLMDTAIGIPGTKFRIGLDPILGLVSRCWRYYQYDNFWLHYLYGNSRWCIE